MTNNCDLIWEKPPSTHNYKYLEIPIVIIWSVVSWEGKQMLAWNSPRFYSYLYSIYAPTIEWIASWIARHFRLYFTGVAYTIALIKDERVGAGGEPQSDRLSLRLH